MKTFLKYRIPAEDTVVLLGDFITTVEGEESDNDFVVTTFNKSKRFVFSENKEHEYISELKGIPLVISKEEYIKNAEYFKGQIISRNLKKAVYSRIMKVERNIDSNALFEKMLVTYPDAFVYHFKSKVLGEWIGATPEKLVVYNKSKLEIMALAGTKKANDNSNWGDKEIEEQKLVAEFIQAKLSNLNVDFEIQNREELVAGPVKHLLNRFLINKENDSWELAKVLHPTPAVSGFPIDKSLELIEEVELHERNLYAGIIGLRGKKIQLYVNLRSAQVIDNQLYLYLGGGFTSDSNIEEEWEETENKAKTILHLLENS